MAITTVGFDGTVTEAQWARMMRVSQVIGWHHGVFSGLGPTAGAGTRTVAVAAGTAWTPGVMVESDAAINVTFAANGASSNRVDYLVLEVNWATNTATVKAVTGNGTTPPPLTQNAGTLWQMPIARVTIRPSVTTIVAGDIVTCYPRARKVYAYQASSFTSRIAPTGSPAEEVAALTLPDPGWPYLVQINAAQRFETDAGASGGSNGYGNLQGSIDGTVVVRGTTERMQPSTGTYGASFTYTTAAAVSGATRVALAIYGTGGAAANNLHDSGANRFEVLQIPA